MYWSSLILRISLRPTRNHTHTFAYFAGEFGIFVSDYVQRVQVDRPDLLVGQRLLIADFDQLDCPVDLHLLVEHLLTHSGHLHLILGLVRVVRWQRL